MNRTALTCTTILTAGLLAGAALLSSSVTAGPLDPPAGPVTPTHKTLSEVEPRVAVNAVNTPGDANSVFKITKPGSYYLTGNVSGAAGKTGIQIESGNVTLDLSGFTVAGVAGATFGVSSITSVNNITVRNGTVRDFGVVGVNIGGDLGRVIDVAALSNGDDGIQTGRQAIVDRCTASGNVGFGILLSENSLVIDSVAAGNQLSGINTGPGGKASRCVTRGNLQNGISAPTGGSVDSCTAAQNGVHGISIGEAGTVTACSTSSNSQDGITASSGSSVNGCTARFNGRHGISAGDFCSISDCSVTLSAVNGIDVKNGATVQRCTVSESGADGISVGNGSSVIGCETFRNDNDGIDASFGCMILNNNCRLDGQDAALGGAGIRVPSNDCRIEGNNCTAADRGIEVISAGNIIIRNTCSGNGVNWVIAANNVFGPILDRTSPGSAAVSGNSAADSTGSTHPNANFTY